MNTRTMTPFQQALETVEALPREDQEELIDVIHRRLVERRRAEIAQNAEETLRAVREGQAHACMRSKRTMEAQRICVGMGWRTICSTNRGIDPCDGWPGIPAFGVLSNAERGRMPV